MDCRVGSEAAPIKPTAPLGITKPPREEAGDAARPAKRPLFLGSSMTSISAGMPFGFSVKNLRKDKSTSRVYLRCSCFTAAPSPFTAAFSASASAPGEGSGRGTTPEQDNGREEDKEETAVEGDEVSATTG